MGSFWGDGDGNVNCHFLANRWINRGLEAAGEMRCLGLRKEKGDYDFWFETKKTLQI